MNVVEPALRLSAQRALLGAITPDVRMIKVRRDADLITFTAICEPPVRDDTREALSVAAAEIVADFTPCRMHENIVGSSEPLPKEHILEEGWVYQRAEDQAR